MGKAVVFEEFGGPEVLHLVNLEDQEPGPGEVRLRVRAIGLNRTEQTLRSGRPPVRPALPSRIGFEAAGEIDAIGPDVSGFQVGDAVALIPTYGAAQFGLYAEKSLAPARSLVKLRPGVNYEQAAATWVAFGTGWSGLVEVGKLSRKQTVAITAASSSAGLAAIQIAKRIGARAVAVTRNGKKAQTLLDQGADAVIATQEQEVDEELKRLTNGDGVDLVLDAVGGPGFAKLLKGTRSGGVAVLYGALDSQPTVLSPFDIFARTITVRGFALPAIARDAAKFDDLVAFVNSGLADGSLRPTIARTFPLAQIVDAHRFLESGEQIGKVVVNVA